MLLVLLAGAAPISAHHSFAVFDHTRTVTVTGTVTRFQWTNPHGFLELDYTGADGRTKHYTIELTSINMLSRAGWTSRPQPSRSPSARRSSAWACTWCIAARAATA